MSIFLPDLEACIQLKPWIAVNAKAVSGNWLLSGYLKVTSNVDGFM
jgi:hypothetical protein